jgi:hypothetical protein
MRNDLLIGLGQSLLRSVAAEVIFVRSVITKSKGLSIDYANNNLRELSEAPSFDESVKVIKGFLQSSKNK